MAHELTEADVERLRPLATATAAAMLTSVRLAAAGLPCDDGGEAIAIATRDRSPAETVMLMTLVAMEMAKIAVGAGGDRAPGRPLGLLAEFIGR